MGDKISAEDDPPYDAPTLRRFYVHDDLTYYSQGYVNQVHHFVDSIVGDAQLRYTGEDGLRCSIHLCQCARSGRRRLSRLTQRTDFQIFRDDETGAMTDEIPNTPPESGRSIWSLVKRRLA